MNPLESQHWLSSVASDPSQKQPVENMETIENEDEWRGCLAGFPNLKSKHVTSRHPWVMIHSSLAVAFGISSPSSHQRIWRIFSRTKPLNLWPAQSFSVTAGGNSWNEKPHASRPQSGGRERCLTNAMHTPGGLRRKRQGLFFGTSALGG